MFRDSHDAIEGRLRPKIIKYLRVNMNEVFGDRSDDEIVEFYDKRVKEMVATFLYLCKEQNQIVNHGYFCYAAVQSMGKMDVPFGLCFEFVGTIWAIWDDIVVKSLREEKLENSDELPDMNPEDFSALF